METLEWAKEKLFTSFIKKKKKLLAYAYFKPNPDSSNHLLHQMDSNISKIICLIVWSYVGAKRVSHVTTSLFQGAT